ncbi:MAG: hypothetical protein HOV80_00230 [Polyangiaceae bacterium]|nr:hypothetical protein [Polyangiaceae bacterium]
MLRSGSERRRALTLLAILVASIAPVGCDVLTGGCGDDLFDEPAALFTEGITEDGTYVSSGWDPKELLDFPPGQKIEFVHGLGVVPASWQAYVATARKGDGSAIVLSTGDVELVQIDEETITVRNATCVDFYLLLTADAL